ncbi:MAG: hypothetical protein ACFCU8_10475 [Thermosynechococcaceae cyanobacterium]
MLSLQSKVRKAQLDVLTIQQRRLREWRREMSGWAFSILGIYILLLMGFLVGLGVGVNVPYGVACDDPVCSFIRIRDVEINGGK